MRSAQRDFIKTTVNDDIKTNPKRFWSYVKSKKQESAGISPLLNKDGFLHGDSHSKAEILNHQFLQSVYTEEDLTTMPDKGPSPFDSMNDIQINEIGIIKLLKGLNQYKASGPDQIPTRFLKTCAAEISPALNLLFQYSINSGTVPSDWREALITSLFKKGAQCSIKLPASVPHISSQQSS